MSALYAGIHKCLPEINKIQNEEPRKIVAEAWVLSLSESELIEGNQSDHLREGDQLYRSGNCWNLEKAGILVDEGGEVPK